MKSIEEKIIQLLQHKIPCAVATIMTSMGSTPRTSGSKMVVLKDRTIYGTIGGGIVEAMVIDACLDIIEKNRCRIIDFSLNRELADGLDMICGGALTVLIEALSPSKDVISLFQAVVELRKKGQKGFLVSGIKGFSRSDFKTQKWLIMKDGVVIMNSDDSIFPIDILPLIQNKIVRSSSPFFCNYGIEEFIVEPVVIQDRIYIFGAGHVGLQLAKIAHITGFQTIITDDRKEFANRERFPDSALIQVVEHFSQAFNLFSHTYQNDLSKNNFSNNDSEELSHGLNIDRNSYIVILTRGHLHDQTVLEAALKTDAAYIGMIGSKTKRDKIYANLEKKGVSRDMLQRVYAPIGLDIHSETPEEIAVSIIAQIIKVRAENRGCR